jgi:hypothetical protein
MDIHYYTFRYLTREYEINCSGRNPVGYDTSRHKLTEASSWQCQNSDIPVLAASSSDSRTLRRYNLRLHKEMVGTAVGCEKLAGGGSESESKLAGVVRNDETAESFAVSRMLCERSVVSR